MAEKKAKAAPRKAAPKRRSEVEEILDRLGLDTPSKGDLDVDGWGPIACGEHNAEPELFETSTDDEHVAPAGYQPTCDACQDRLLMALEHANRDTTRV